MESVGRRSVLVCRIHKFSRSLQLFFSVFENAKNEFFSFVLVRRRWRRVFKINCYSMYSLDVDLKRKASKNLETFIYYVVGHSVMKQLLDEDAILRMGERTVGQLISFTSAQRTRDGGEANGNQGGQDKSRLIIVIEVRTIIIISSIGSVLNLLKSLKTNKLISSPIKLYGVYRIALKHHCH